MKKFRFLILLIFAAFLLPSGALFAAESNGNSELGVERYAIYVGSNVGGKNNQRLLYAGSDAISFQKTMAEIGGIPTSNGLLLLDPSKADLDEALQMVSEMISQNRQHSKRSEFIFYYSGHSDENALLLGRTSYDYSELKAAISSVPSDVHVVILDSCYSGNFIRTKGGQRKKPFLLDDSTVVKGHAYLSSSSSQEFSQESDEIGSSFFTNAMLTGLRGAADSSGDKKVTLNELYSYAFSETLSKTENSSAGPQHPNYNITLVGSGDLVLSDISSSDCIVHLSEKLQGRVLIRYKNGKLVSEINKVGGSQVFLALEKGDYSATIIEDTATLQGTFTVTSGRIYELSENSFNLVATTSNRVRGDRDADRADDAEEESDSDDKEAFDSGTLPEDIKFVPIEFSFVMNEFSRSSNKKIKTPLSLSLFHSNTYKVNGIMFGIGVNEAGYVSGAQVAGVFNSVHELSGLQMAAIFNKADDFRGLQISSIFNKADNILGGKQLSALYNRAEDVKGAQISGITNAAKNLQGGQIAGISNTANDVSGGQISAVLNNAKDVKGAQISAIINNAKDVKGTQITAIVNKADDVKGLQLGIVNVAKNVDGLQIGLINLCNDGILELGMSFTSNRNIHATFRSGKEKFYAIVGFAVTGGYIFNNYDGSKKFNFLYGFGTRARVDKFNFDFEAYRIADDDDGTDDDVSFSVNFCKLFIPSIRGSVGFTPVKHLNIFAGLSLTMDYLESSNVYKKFEKNMIIKITDNFRLFPEFDMGVKYCFK